MIVRIKTTFDAVPFSLKFLIGCFACALACEFYVLYRVVR